MHSLNLTIEPGVYHLRQIIHNDTCAQVYPGLEGNYFFQANSNQDHFAVDRVIHGSHQFWSWVKEVIYLGVVHYENPSQDYIFRVIIQPLSYPSVLKKQLLFRLSMM